MQIDSFSAHRQRADLKLKPERCAVLVVDMLNDFLVQGGAMPLLEGRVTIEPIRRLIQLARPAGARIIWICDWHPGGDDAEFRKRTPHCLDGTWGCQIVDELRPDELDYQIRKRRYSGFFQTDLDLRLHEWGIEQLIVTGVVTNICVRSTVHDGFFAGYHCLVPVECVAATGPREQDSSLYDIDTHFGDVVTLDWLADRLQAAPAVVDA